MAEGKGKSKRHGCSSISTKRKNGRTKAERKANVAKNAAKAKKRPASKAAKSSTAQKPSKKARDSPELNVARSNTDAPIVEDDNGALAIAADLMLNLPPHVWWSTLHDYDCELDVATGVRQEWSLLVPVWIKSRLYTPPPAHSNKLQFNKNRWDDLVLLIQNRDNVKLHVEPLQLKGKSKVWCVAIGTKKKAKPKLPSAVSQMRLVLKKGIDALGIKTGRGRRRNTRRNNVDDAAMTERLQQFRDVFHKQFLAFATKQVKTNDDILDAMKQYMSELVAETERLSKQLSDGNNANVGSEDEGGAGGNAGVAGGTGGEEDQPTIVDAVEAQITSALDLDLDIRPRPKRDGSDTIEIHDRKQTRETERLIAISLARMWGYDDEILTRNQRLRIAKAACTQLAYDHGFPKVTGGSMMQDWIANLSVNVTKGDTQPLASGHKGSKSKTDKIEEEHLGYLHELYRYAITTVGVKATFMEIAEVMNAKSQSPSETRPELNLHYKQVYRWWKANDGKEVSPFEKPRLTDKHKADRVDWVTRWGPHFLDEEFPVCYLDEKWFYTTTRRRKLKILPRGKHEPVGADIVSKPKTRSRRFPIKVMYLGVVGRPRTVNGRRFNGRIMLERVSRTEEAKKKTKHTRFSTDALVNYEIKSGGWKELYTNGMTVEDMCAFVVDMYDLEEEEAARLEFHYERWTGQANKTKSNIRLKPEDQLIGHTAKRKSGETFNVGLDDLHLGIRLQEGDKTTQDINCDSNYMLEIMPKVGQAIRDAFFWVAEDHYVYLVLDSAGGHGTKEAIAKYKQQMYDDYKIILVHQIPQSPETNVLDLGIWMSLQSAVEKCHRLMRGDKQALDASVMKVWKDVANEEAFTKVFDRLNVNYAAIKKFGGKNDFCEDPQFRGKDGMKNLADYVVGVEEEVGVEEVREGGGDDDGIEAEM